MRSAHLLLAQLTWFSSIIAVIGPVTAPPTNGTTFNAPTVTRPTRRTARTKPLNAIFWFHLRFPYFSLHVNVVLYPIQLTFNYKCVQCSVSNELRRFSYRWREHTYPKAVFHKLKPSVKKTLIRPLSSKSIKASSKYSEVNREKIILFVNYVLKI